MEINFQLISQQGLIYEDTRKRFALWRLGHLVKKDDGSPLYALCLKSNGEKPYYLTAIRWGSPLEIYLKGDKQETLNIPPEAPKYEIPEYHKEYRIEYRKEHYFRDDVSRERINEILPWTLGNDRRAFATIVGAIELAHRIDIKPVPQYYIDTQADIDLGYQYYLPLYIEHEEYETKRPDLVAALVVNHESRKYVVRTILKPGWAYGRARAISVGDEHSRFKLWADVNPEDLKSVIAGLEGASRGEVDQEAIQFKIENGWEEGMIRELIKNPEDRHFMF